MINDSFVTKGVVNIPFVPHKMSKIQKQRLLENI